MGTVTINLAGLAGNAETRIGVSGSAGNGKDGNGQVKNGSVFIGNLNQPGADRVEQRRAQARKQANKMLMDQFGRDNEVTDTMDELRTRNRDIGKEIGSLREQIKEFKDGQEAMREQHGIMPDSEEQKQLDLIRKVRGAMDSGDGKGLTADELKQVAGMDTSQLTTYQRTSLDTDEVIKRLEKEIEKLEGERRGNTSTVTGLKQGLLKTSYKGITKAYEAADSIMDAASDDIIGMLVQDAKAYVDEKLEEIVEAAKKKAEEKEEEEKKEEAAEEKKETQEELTQAIKEAASEQAGQMEQIAESTDAPQAGKAEENNKVLEIAEQQEDLQKTVDKMLREAKLLEEDMKGLMVDGLY